MDRFLDGSLALVVLAVPLVFYPRAFNALLVKDFALGVLVSLMGTAILVSALRGRRISWPRSPVNAPVWATLVVTVVALLFSSYRYAGVGAFLRLVVGASLYLVVIHHVRQIAQAKRLLLAVAIAALLTCMYGAAQRSHMDFVRWAEELDRIPGSYGNATYFASYLILLLPLMITMAVFPPVEGGNRNTARAFFAVTSAIMFLCLLWTKTTAAIGGLAFGLGVGAVALAYLNAANSDRRFSRKAALITALAVLGALGLASGLAPAKYRDRVLSLAHPTDMADVRRVLIWQSALQIFSEKPVLGGGPGTYQIYSRGRYAPRVLEGEVREASGALHAHNFFLETLAETGGIGGVTLIWLLGTYFWAVIKAVKSVRDAFWRNLVIALAAGVLAYLIQNMFAVTFFVPGCQMFLWLALALTVAARQQGEDPAPVRAIAPRLTGAPRRIATAAVVVAVLVLWIGGAVVIAAEYHFWRGEGLGDSGLFDQAAVELSQAVSLNPYCQRGWYQLGAALGKQRRWREAAQAVERSAALSPDYLRTQYNLGAACFSLKEYERAARAFQRALQAEESALNYKAVSDAYARQGELDLAITWAERGIRRYPTDIPLRQHAASLLLQTGDPNRAQRLRALLQERLPHE